MTGTDVLVAGAGPTGLVTALWLAAQGIRVRIIDKTDGPGQTSRATVVHARTLELYRQLGIGDAVADTGHRVTAVNMWAGGRRRAHVRLGDAGAALSPYPFVLIHPQDLHEKFLIERLTERGVQVERRTELVDFSQDRDAVTIQLRGPDGGARSCTAAYLAGCDGAGSAVRKRLGAGFEGGTYDHLFYVADVDVRNDALKGEIHVAFKGPDFMLIMPYGPPGKFRFVGALRTDRLEQARPLGFDDVGHDAIRMLGLDIGAVNWFSTYHVHHRVTDHFRHGRAFLLGDAAHIHSPVGGQGMNTGIGDAINLAWKLAAVLKGNASDSLLDSFEAERPAFARRLVATTDRAFTVVVKPGGLAEFVRNHVAPLLLEAVSGLEPARDALFRLVSQTMIHYPDSPLSAGKAGRVSGGDRLPYVRFDGGDNYASSSTPGWQVHVYGTGSAELHAWCARHGLPLREFPWCDAFDAAGLARDALYLLRPDSYVGLAQPGGDHRGIEAYFISRGIRAG